MADNDPISTAILQRDLDTHRRRFPPVVPSEGAMSGRRYAVPDEPAWRVQPHSGEGRGGR